MSQQLVTLSFKMLIWSLKMQQISLLSPLAKSYSQLRIKTGLCLCRIMLHVMNVCIRGCIITLILNLSTGSSWVVNCSSLWFYFQGNIPQCLLERRNEHCRGRWNPAPARYWTQILNLPGLILLTISSLVSLTSN